MAGENSEERLIRRVKWEGRERKGIHYMIRYDEEGQ